MTDPDRRGPHRWIADDAAFASLVDTLASVDAYGLDTEFHRERTYHARLALLQLSWPEQFCSMY